MTHFDRAYTAEWKVVTVDPDTWDDGVEVEGVYSVSVNRDATDSIPLLETATLEVDADAGDDFEEGWYRLLMIAEQDLKYERHALSTVLLQRSDDNLSYGRQTISLSGSSVLKPLEDRKNIGTDYRYAPKGVNGAEWVADLLESVTPAPVEVSGDGYTLDDSMSFTPGISYLEMAWKVLDAKKWCMMVDGDGLITITERPTTPILDLTLAKPKGIHLGSSRTLDYSQVCNRYYAIDRDGSREIAENHNPNSRVSYERRGRWKDYVDTAPTKVDGETLYAYARRRLEEESTVVRTYKYSREYWPEVYPFSLVAAYLPQMGLDGELRVLTQAMTCSKGITVDETAGLEIKEWTA